MALSASQLVEKTKGTEQTALFLPVGHRGELGFWITNDM